MALGGARKEKRALGGRADIRKRTRNKAEQILSKYGVGQLLAAGDNRYLSDDLMRLLSYVVRTSGGDSALPDAECLSGNTVYAPMTGYAENKTYTLLRSPHIARNEEALVRPLGNIGEFRQKYLSHLHYVLMVDSRSLIPERLGGADFDGDMIKTVADPLLNQCVQRNYTGENNIAYKCKKPRSELRKILVPSGTNFTYIFLRIPKDTY